MTQHIRLLEAIVTMLTASEAMGLGSVTFSGTDAGDQNRLTVCLVAGVHPDTTDRKARSLVRKALRAACDLGVKKTIVPSASPDAGVAVGDAPWSYGYRLRDVIFKRHLRNREGLRELAESRRYARCREHREFECLPCVVTEWSAKNRPTL